MTRPRNTNVLDQLRRDIMAGCFDHVPFLPSERELAERYDTGRGVIRNVLSDLIAEKKLIRVPHHGTRLNRTKEEVRFHRFLLRLRDPEVLRGFEMSGLVSGICGGAASLCAEAVLSCSSVSLDAEELRERFDTGNLQGVIFLESLEESDRKAVEDAGVPYVVANLEQQQDALCCRMDYRQIGHLAGVRLLRSGYRRYAVFSGPKEHFIFREMLAGFRGALAEEEIMLSPDCVAAGDRVCALEKLKSLLSLPKGRRPEAVFTMRDNRAELLYHLLGELHLKVPEDVAVISYDNITWPTSEEQGLTTVSQEVRQIGIRSVELLQEWYDTGRRPEDCIIPGELIERSSIKPEKRGRK